MNMKRLRVMFLLATLYKNLFLPPSPYLKLGDDAFTDWTIFYRQFDAEIAQCLCNIIP